MSSEKVKHLCKLVKKDFPKKNPDEYAGLISDPQYFCADCGLSSHFKNRLCEPKHINC